MKCFSFSFISVMQEIKKNRRKTKLCLHKMNREAIILPWQVVFSWYFKCKFMVSREKEIDRPIIYLSFYLTLFFSHHSTKNVIYLVVRYAYWYSMVIFFFYFAVLFISVFLFFFFFHSWWYLGRNNIHRIKVWKTVYWYNNSHTYIMLHSWFGIDHKP